MNKRIGLLPLVTALGAALSVDAAAAESEGWTYSVAPYLWMAGLEGDVGTGGNTAEVDESFTDIAENMDLGVLAQFEAHNGRLGLVLSPVYLKISASGNGPAGFIDADVEVETAIVDMFATWALTPELDLLAGGRYTQLDLEVQLTGPLGATESRDGSKGWLDPIVGARWVHPLSDKWLLSLRGDVGGFGVESDAVWNATALLGYKLSGATTLFFGYRALDYDYKDGSAAERFTWDVRMEGPLIGANFNLQGNP